MPVEAQPVAAVVDTTGAPGYLSIRDLRKEFDGFVAVDDVNLDVRKGEIFALLGGSGSGKSTLLRCLAGFETPTRGKILLDGQEINALPPYERPINMMFQSYALFPHMTVEQNIAFGLKQDGMARDAIARRVGEMLELVQLQKLGKRKPHQLSGGQQQRVALARALAPKPELVLLDEPFSNLDADLRTRLSKEVRSLLKQEKTSALLVTHDQQEAFAMADKIGIMADGRLQQWDTPYNLYHNPATPAIAGFIGQGVLLRGQMSGSHCVRLALGEFCGVVPHHCQSCREVDVLLRPDDVVHDDNSPVSAEVLDKDFKGSYFIYTLKLDSGETVLAHVPSHHNHPIGSRIGIRLELEHLIAFARP